MKNLRIICLVTVFLWSNNLVNAQKPCLDSICVQIDEQVKCDLAIYDYKDLSVRVQNDLRSLQSILKDGIDIPQGISYSIDYDPGKKLAVKQSTQSERVIWENGRQTSYHLDNQCNILTANYYLHIQFNKLERLLSDSLLFQMREVIDTTSASQGRLSMIYNYSFQGKDLVRDQHFNKIDGQLDVLSLKGGVGVNLIRNQPIVDLSAEMGLIFCKKGILKNQYYLSYNQLSQFDDNSTVHLNGFFNVGYRHNLSNNKSNPNWLGLELGYLTTRNGDLFEKNTFRLGVNWEIGKYITVSPQWYISDQQTYPAIRIGFGL